MKYATYLSVVSVFASFILFIEQVLVLFLSLFSTPPIICNSSNFSAFTIYLYVIVWVQTHRYTHIPLNSFNFKLNKHHMSWTETNVIDTSHSNLRLVNRQHTAQRQKQ